MTGLQHYREAERLAERADHYIYGDGCDPVTGFAAMAQVHATLALAAATALTGPMASDGYDDDPTLKAWVHAAGEGN